MSKETTTNYVRKKVEHPMIEKILHHMSEINMIPYACKKKLSETKKVRPYV